jgi:hypothetical protein
MGSNFGGGAGGWLMGPHFTAVDKRKSRTPSTRRTKRFINNTMYSLQAAKRATGNGVEQMESASIPYRYLPYSTLVIC